MPETIAGKRIIVLTTDPDRLAMLRRKRDEYVERYFFQPPEASPRGAYKLRLLDRLLEKGTLDVAEIADELAAKSGWHDSEKFESAVNVITGYNSGDLSKLEGGTGLK